MINTPITPTSKVKKYTDVFFDLDHTLWDFDTNAKEALREVFENFSIESKITTSFADFYTIYLHHNAILWDRYHKGFISSEDLKWKRMWRALLDLKLADEKLAKEMSAEFLQILPTKTLLFEYTVEILEYLADKKYAIHLITNGFEKTQWSKINNSEITKYFTHVITSEGSGYVKPSKEIFEFAVNKAGGTIENAIMIGDNQDADIQGAINAGMDNIFVNHIKADLLLEPTYTIYHLKELENIL